MIELSSLFIIFFKWEGLMILPHCQKSFLSQTHVFNLYSLLQLLRNKLLKRVHIIFAGTSARFLVVPF